MKNTLFEASFKARKILSWTKVFLIGAAFGAIATAMLLDNRAGAVVKAFNNPQAVNAADIQTEIIKN